MTGQEALSHTQLIKELTRKVINLNKLSGFGLNAIIEIHLMSLVQLNQLENSKEPINRQRAIILDA